MGTRGVIALGLAASAAAASIAGAASPPADRNGGATASAYAVRIVLPNHQPVVRAPSAAPPGGTAFVASYQAPADASVIKTGALTSKVSAQPGQRATASAVSSVTSLSIFNGEITADAVSAGARATATPSGSSGDLASDTGFTNLIVLGQVVPQPTPNQRIALGDWGYAIVLEQPQAPAPSPGYHGFVTALDIHITADHGDLPAGSEVQIGYAEADAQPAPAGSSSSAAQPSGPGLPAVPSARSGPSGAPPEPRANGVPPVIQSIPKITPALTAGGYVFPVYGPSSYGDTFGAPRADVGWHHGDDIFGQLGQPLLAVANGTVFSVGWNDIGGNRLWLRDAQGNEFYYAHLSAFSPLAVNGAQVHAGDVVGFMGNTGDAEGTPVHLHFEIHPVGLLPLGYDGAVDPTSYLEAWQHQQDLSFATASGFSPAGSLAPEPGAILLQASDISSANGLEPGSLERAMAPVSSEGDAALVGGLPPAARAAAAGGDLGKG
jgi:murein DD-endopeptidase MepM/ murein hydrolase activator NlpD